MCSMYDSAFPLVVYQEKFTKRLGQIKTCSLFIIPQN